MSPLLIGDLGTPELVIILVVFMLIFGGKKLPELARGSGRALRIFKSEVNSHDDDETAGDETSSAGQAGATTDTATADGTADGTAGSVSGDLEARQAAELRELEARHEAEKRARDSRG